MLCDDEDGGPLSFGSGGPSTFVLVRWEEEEEAPANIPNTSSALSPGEGAAFVGGLFILRLIFELLFAVDEDGVIPPNIDIKPPLFPLLPLLFEVSGDEDDKISSKSPPSEVLLLALPEEDLDCCCCCHCLFLVSKSLIN